MEGFTYNNIFETKGIEYIIILAFLTVLVPFWFFISNNSETRQKFARVAGSFTQNILKIPRGIFFSKNHTWIHLEKSGIAKIGLDNFLFNVVGKVKINQLKKTGEKVKKGELFAEIVQNEKKLKLYSPVSGTITNTNSAIPENSETIKIDAYEKGWFYELEPDNWKVETSGFYLADEASEWIKNEVIRFKDFLNTSLARYSGQPAMLLLQDGGELTNDPLDNLNSEIWHDFQKEFLD